MRKLLPYLSVLVIIAAVYSGYVMISRWQSRRDEARAAKEAEVQRAKDTIDLLGGDALRIIQFAVNPDTVRPGGRAVVCYGVSNAASVRIEPHIEDITPSLSRCLEIFPKQSIEYKLTADDGHGHTAAKSIAIKVQ